MQASLRLLSAVATQQLPSHKELWLFLLTNISSFKQIQCVQIQNNLKEVIALRAVSDNYELECTCRLSCLFWNYMNNKNIQPK